MKIFLSVTVLAIILACSQDEGEPVMQVSCDRESVISNEKYESAPSDPLTIHGLAINDDCLKINFSSSGCDGDTWKPELVVSEAILFSLPPQRNLRLSLENDEMCEAIVTKEISFDISNLKAGGTEVRLNISNSDESIIYEY